MTEKLDKKFLAKVAAFLIAFPIFYHAVTYQAVDAIAQLTSFKIFVFGMACIAGVAILSRWHYVLKEKVYWPDEAVLPPHKKRYWPNGEEDTVKPDERLTLKDWQTITKRQTKLIDELRAKLDSPENYTVEKND